MILFALGLVFYLANVVDFTLSDTQCHNDTGHNTDSLFQA